MFKDKNPRITQLPNLIITIKNNQRFPIFIRISLYTFYDIFNSLLSELWRQENAMQQNLAMLKEELSKKDQGLRSMTGKV